MSHTKTTERLDRHSGTGNLGLPKKGGAGGKGTWGVAGSETDAVTVFDKGDPNYDSEEEISNPVDHIPAVAKFKETVAIVLEEYFSNGDTSEVARSLRELDKPQFHPEFVKKAISLAIDRKDLERELTSTLFSSLYLDILSSEDLERGFVLVLEAVDDLSIDAPAASDIIAMFIARAVVDEVIPPSFINNHRQHTYSASSLAKATLDKAYGLLDGKHAAQRVSHGWGPGDGKSVKRLKERVDLILNEYLLTKDFVEADKTIRELNAHFFHFQIIKRALTIGLGKKQEDREAFSSLIATLNKSGLISDSQIMQGFKKFIEYLDDISLDIPNAPGIVKDSLFPIALKDGYLPRAFVEEAEGHIKDRIPAP